MITTEDKQFLDLHPKEHLPTIRLELEKIDPACCALSHVFIFHVIRKYNQILNFDAHKTWQLTSPSLYSPYLNIIFIDSAALRPK